MRPTFLGFETARRGMAAGQKGIDITGQNITNINTPGYTRQRVDFVSVAGTTNSRYQSNKVAMAGQGVQMNGVSQIRNPYLDSRFRSEFSETGYYDKALSMLDGIESVLNEVDGGLKPIFNNFVTALQDLSGKPDQVTNANIVLSTATNLTQILRQYSGQLEKLNEQYLFDLKVDVNNMNTILSKISELNNEIATEVSTNTNVNNFTGVNELLDQRNLLLDQLAQYGNIRVSNNEDGSVKIEMNEHVILDGTKFEQINLDVNPDKTVNLVWQTTGDRVVLQSGTIKASHDFINGTSGETKGIRYYQQQLNDFAKEFANIVNSAFKQTDGTYKQLITGGVDNVIDAKNITINSIWVKDPGYLLKDIDNEGSLDNKHILELISKLEGKQKIGTFEGSFRDFIDSYSTILGQDKNYYDSRFEASYTIVNDLENKRDAVSAVSYDEEGSNLMIFDKAYKAASRLMTTLDEALDVLINRTGLVGR